MLLVMYLLMSQEARNDSILSQLTTAFISRGGTRKIRIRIAERETINSKNVQ